MISLNIVVSSIGAFLSILGGTLAITAFLANTNKVIMEQCSTKWGYNDDLLKSLIFQRDTAIGGFLLITLGSICQLMSLLIKGSYSIRLCIFLTILLGIFLSFFLIKKIIIILGEKSFIASRIYFHLQMYDDDSYNDMLDPIKKQELISKRRNDIKKDISEVLAINIELVTENKINELRKKYC